MASLNKILLMGNLTRDPEVRYIPSGAAVADMRMAVNRRYKTQQGEDREETCFVNVSAWGRTAETCGQYLSKGSQVLVEGRLRYDEWEKEGQKQSRLSVVAERVQFLDSPRRAQYGDAPNAPNAPNTGGAGAGGDEPDDAPDAGREKHTDPAAADDDDLPF